MRCKHLSQCEVAEEMITHISHIIVNGQKVNEVFEDGQGYHTGFIEIRCTECGYSRRFNRYVSVRGLRHVPAWARQMADRAGIPFHLYAEATSRRRRRDGRGGRG